MSRIPTAWTAVLEARKAEGKTVTYTPTEEQADIIESVRAKPKTNFIVKSLAGSAKTTTLEMIANAVPARMLCVAFNKRIVLEMKERLPAHCDITTFNSLGHRTWASAIGKRLILDKDKTYNLLSQAIQKLSGREQEEAYAEMADTIKMIDMGKSSGYIPTGRFKNAKALMGDDDFFASLEEVPSLSQERLIREVSFRSIEQGFDGKIDFNDQILLPTVFPAMFDSYPEVLVDESQDLSELNHAMLRKMLKGGRLTAVGDECQSIYAFRGAHVNSMQVLQDTFSMESKVLSICFRCPIKVVEAARWRAPHMRYPEWAIEGKVEVLSEWTKNTVPETAAIICRNNAPLFGMAIKLLKNGRYPQIIGNDIGKYLVKVMKKFGKTSMPTDEIHVAISNWADEKLKKSRNASKVHDQAECLRIFANTGQTLGDAIAYAEHLFNSQGPIQLMTGHKSKGLEFDTVFFLDEHLIKNDEQQEQNLRYVIQTRAKKELYYVNSENFFDEYEEAA